MTTVVHVFLKSLDLSGVTKVSQQSDTGILT